MNPPPSHSLRPAVSGCHRRDFLRTSLLGGALSWTVPSFLAGTCRQLAAAPSLGSDGRILVVMQLAGGNDGLNTLVPYQDDDYYRARPTLAIPSKEVIRLSDAVGLAPAAAALQPLYDAGRLAMIQGVGYPNPNRSHFRSTEIWHTAVDSHQSAQHGWIGRYFDHACSGEDARVGLALSRQTPQAFVNAGSKGISLQNPEALSATGDGAGMGMTMEGEGGTVTDYAGMPMVTTGSALDFLERVALDAEVSGEQIAKITREGRNEAAYPRTPLAADLAFVSRMIAGEMPTRVYYVSQGGYDTHRGQKGAHERLLTQFSEAMQAFVKDLAAQGNLERVLVLTFSEFGRRVAENGSAGTDHGTAAPVFLVGASLKPGLAGSMPSLAKRDLLDGGDLAHRIDFRSVYASLLGDWMGVPPPLLTPILGRSFPPLGMRLAG